MEILERETLLHRQAIFGYTNEDLDKVIKPMALDGSEPIGSMGYDASLAVLSRTPQLLFNYFKQKFAQVTNPPIDAIREEFVTSLEVMLGSGGNLLQPTQMEYKKIRLKTPILSRVRNAENTKFTNRKTGKQPFPTLYPVQDQLETVLDDLFQKVNKEIEEGSNILILSDRKVNKRT